MALWQLKVFKPGADAAGPRRIVFVNSETGQKDELLIEVDESGRFEAPPSGNVGCHWFARRIDKRR